MGHFGRNGFGEIQCRAELWGVRVETEHKGYTRQERWRIKVRGEKIDNKKGLDDRMSDLDRFQTKQATTDKIWRNRRLIGKEATNGDILCNLKGNYICFHSLSYYGLEIVLKQCAVFPHGSCHQELLF